MFSVLKEAFKMPLTFSHSVAQQSEQLCVQITLCL